MKACVFTLGCKVNEVESAYIMAALSERGIEVCDKLCPADIYVLNTCAVTAEAERKSRQLISRARKFNPMARIYVCGCASEKNGGQFLSHGVKFVCGARNKERVVGAVLSEELGVSAENPPFPSAPMAVRTREFIKIEDGCDNFCSYCIIPYLRGRVVSRPVSSVCEQVKSGSSPEIVLTGINISAYNDGGADLGGLLRALAFTDKRVRLGSIECNVIDENFLLACKGLKNFASQFHLSLQSGSDRILKAMNRHYTRAEYLQKCALIYSFFPEAAITTDIIAGFCGESAEDFAQSLSIIEEAGFSRLHAFAYSPREGTAAYGKDDIPAAVKSERVRALIEEGKRSAAKFIRNACGKRGKVIFEEFDGLYTAGYTGNYIRVYAEGRFNGSADVVLGGQFRDGALCEVIS